MPRLARAVASLAPFLAVASLAACVQQPPIPEYPVPPPADSAPSAAPAPAAAPADSAVAAPAQGQPQQPAPRTPPAVNIVRLTENLALLVGGGGNVAISIGEDGTFLVDDQVAPMAPVLKAVTDSIDPRGVRFVLNTHWHDDHTGGNERFGAARAVIVAHENVRRRLSVDQFIAELGDSVKAAPKGALPVVTFTRGLWFHLNGDNIQVLHLDAAHTDGDAIVRWAEQNVIHTGDIYFNGAYPFIDISSGGSLDGVVSAVDSILALSNEHTRIIPGHGPLSNATELRAYRDMLVSVRDRLRKALAARRSADAVVAAGLTKEWDAQWGQGFMKPEQFTRIAYESVRRSQAARPKPARRGRARS